MTTEIFIMELQEALPKYVDDQNTGFFVLDSKMKAQRSICLAAIVAELQCMNCLEPERK